VYFPVHHYAGQAVSSSASPSSADPLANVAPDQAMAGGIVIGAGAVMGIFLGGILLYVWNPALGIPRWALAVLGGIGGGIVGTLVGVSGAMPIIGEQPTAQQWLNLATPSSSSPYVTTPSAVTDSPSMGPLI
jgi:hypothetical protein